MTLLTMRLFFFLAALFLTVHSFILARKDRDVYPYLFSITFGGCALAFLFFLVGGSYE